MKFTKFFTGFALMAALVVMMSSCGGSAKDNLPGKWKISDITLEEGADMSEEEKQAFEQAKAMMPMVKGMLTAITIELTAEGDAIMWQGEEKKEGGSWSLSDDESTITIKENADDEGTSATINSISGSAAEIVVEKDGVKGVISLSKE